MAIVQSIFLHHDIVDKIYGITIMGFSTKPNKQYCFADVRLSLCQYNFFGNLSK